MPWLEAVPIAVSNNIDEEELARLAQEVGWKWVCGGGSEGPVTLKVLAGLSSASFPQGSEVNTIGIGTSVVTCPQQPSLGCVYKVGTVSGPRLGGSRHWGR